MNTHRPAPVREAIPFSVRGQTTLVAISVLLTAFGLQPTTAQRESGTTHPSIDLPAELDRVLRDYERAWRARDAEALASLFTEDGFVLSPGRPPVRGRMNIEQRYATSGGPLALRALAFSTADSVGYIIGAYTSAIGMTDDGKFILALRKGPNGQWLIAADMDNGNQRDD